MNKAVTFVSLSAAIVTIPPAAHGAVSPGTHMVGAGLLIATRENTRWRFSREAATIAAGETEQNLLLWLADRLPMADTLIGWKIDEHLVPALIDAAAHADPAIAHHFLVRLARALRNNVVDLSINCRDAGASSDMTPEALLGNWGAGRLDAVRQDLAQEALGSWLAFVRQGTTLGAEVERATRAWMHRSSIIHLVESGPDAA